MVLSQNSKGHYDIIVAGGGPSGFTAGIAASRQGANVLIIEKQNCLGGGKKGKKKNKRIKTIKRLRS